MDSNEKIIELLTSIDKKIKSIMLLVKSNRIKNIDIKGDK